MDLNSIGWFNFLGAALVALVLPLAWKTFTDLQTGAAVLSVCLVCPLAVLGASVLVSLGARRVGDLGATEMCSRSS
jgi:hypothetical protein